MRMLVVEDEHRIANAIQKGLTQERFAVDVAYTGTEGLDLASTEEYDLIILDLMLPEISGLEICERLRNNNIQAPILMLTAKGQIRDKVKGLNTGADDYMTKPFAFEELLARVRALIRRPKNAVQETIRVGSLSLNAHTFEIKRGTTPIQLSLKEFSVLEFLMRNQNTVVSKDRIIHHVWDYNADILPNTVEATIKNLRKKIDKPYPGKKPTIHTVRGFGYKLA